MSQLQLGLGVLGGVVLVAMLGYYLWLAGKSRPRQPDFVPTNATDPFGREPTLDVESLGGASEEEPGFAIPLPEKKPGLDALIDVIAPIALEAPVSGDAVLAALPPTRRVGSKPFAVEGLNAATQHWESPQNGQRYTQLQAGLQLANRAGALNDIEYSEFVMKAQSFCDVLNGTPDFPEMRREVNRARELDLFASDHDAQIGFALRARRSAWSPSYVQQMAARLGFVPGSMAGRMVLPGASGPVPVLSLNFDTQAALAEDMSQSALRELSLALDVPQVERAERAFARMCEVAQALAKEMDGVVTDDGGVPLPTEALEVIAAELEQLYDTLDQHGLSAGSTLARRLFS
ncbi:cell division protein ZipA C-terminal FtsZ-binding domain-containing protein [Rhodoferax sp.]|uniref:cell division protein ZipA C-terminal FtsZ-binding domain-containing protein n=1 Tax=Rhodoferax sp. TaxID=50421 RepID=UPI00284697F9|nr:cell division protein ZipA C-terminal FtsZ-binding domain-containing protein [Rhodoferax sp.]MDR3368322.1 cell division protein ZipA C-terminal FtsZ-binding domain-containing protein [Rhodoferax sp.]